MKLKLTNLSVLLALVLGLVSCMHDNFNECPINVPEPKSNVYLNFSVGILRQANEGRTRANNTTDEENYFENPSSYYEKIKTLRILILRGERTTNVDYLKDSTDYVEHNRLISINDLGVDMLGDLTFKVRGGEKKNLYFIANEEFISKKTGINFDDIKPNEIFDGNRLENLILTRISDVSLIDNQEESAEKYYIPMCEDYEIAVPMPVQDEQYIDYGNFFITRAAVKCSFNVKFASNEFSNKSLYLKKIIFNGFSDKEYFFPQNTVYTDLIVDPISGLEGKFIESYDTPADLTQTSFTFDCDIPFSKDYVPFSPPLYFPESLANTDYSVSVILDVKDKFDKFQGEEIVLPPVKLNNLPSLPRNTHVMVNMTLTDHSIENAEVTVFPYTGVYLNPEFGFSPETQQPGSISQTEIELTVGQTAILTASFNLDNTTIKNLIWVTSNADVVTVSTADEEGVVMTTGDAITVPSGKAVMLTAKKAGEATITVYAQNGQIVTCKVTVKQS